MLRKTLVAFAAVASLAMAALAPTAASAKFGFGFHHHHFGHFGIAVYPGYDGDCYLVKKRTYYGYRLIKICE